MKRNMLFVVLALLLVAAPVFAQDTAPTYEYPTLDLKAIAAMLVNTVGGMVLAAFGAAPVTVVLVNILKKVPALDRYGSPTLVLIVSSVLYVLALGASAVGATVQFQGLLDFIAVSAPALVSFITTLFSAPTLYNAAVKRDVPLVGQQRNVW